MIGDKELIEQVIKAKDNRDEMVKLNQVIFIKGIKNECPLCRCTIDFFLELYGQIAGNFASAVLSTGGVHLLKGMSAVLEPYLRSNSIFFYNFISKLSLKPILEKMPIAIVKNTNLRLKRALEYARRIIENKAIH